MKIKRLTIIFIFVVFTTSVYTQNKLDNIYMLRKNAISFSILGPTPLLGITYERVLAPKLSVELGIGLPSAGLGIKIFPTNIQVDIPLFHIGITATYFATQESEMTPAPSLVVYIPIGVAVFKRGGFNFAFDMGPGYAFNMGSNDSWDRFLPYGNLKFGKRF